MEHRIRKYKYLLDVIWPVWSVPEIETKGNQGVWQGPQWLRRYQHPGAY